MPYTQKLDDFPSLALAKYYHRLLIERAIRLTFADRKGSYPVWANNDFDEQSLVSSALPVVSDSLASDEPLDALQLAQRWAMAYRVPAPSMDGAVTELIPVADALIAAYRETIA